ncbi:MAG: hypothetical protein K0R09_1366 [Clostridiales bacterium]|jgi:hypothetical protein|nr:hypothetical protein [Clostridiales bacterium]
MEKLDLLSVVLVLVGSTMVYGARRIFKLFKFKNNEVKFIIFKFVGLIIALIGFFRILDII